MRTFITLAFIGLAAGALGAQSVPVTSPPPGALSNPQLTDEGGAIDPAWLSPVNLGGRTGISASIETRGERRYTPPVSTFGPPCDVACTGTAEGEACGTDTNGGCGDSCAASFVLATPGTTYCGSVFADGGLRDTDWYRVSLAQVTTLDLTITSEFPSQLTLFELGGTPGDCAALLALQTANGDNCVAANLTRTVAAGDYIIFVSAGDATGPIFDGFPCAAGAGNQNDYRLQILGNSPAACLTCGGTAEVEACGADLNGGCNATPFAFDPITVTAAPLTRCGTAWAEQATQTRDTDWYSFTLAAPTNLSWSFEAEFPGAMFVIRDPLNGGVACTGADFQFVGVSFSSGCVPVSGSGTAAAGTYYVFVSVGDNLGAIFTGAACTDAADYTFTINTTATPPCLAVCPIPSGGTPEGEVCVTPGSPNVNAGCNTPFGAGPPGYTAIAPGTTVSGISWADAGFRDSDWFRFTAASSGTVTVTLTNNLDSPSAVNDGGILLGFSDVANPGMFDLPSAGAGLNSCGGAAAVGAAQFLGQFVPPTCTGTSFNFNVVAGADYVLTVVHGLNTGAGNFFGLPCLTPACYGYNLALSAITTGCTQPPTGTCDSDCVNGQLTFNLTAPAAQGYSDIEITIADINGVVVGTVNTGAVAAGAVIAPTFTPTAAGFYDVTFDATCTQGGVVTVVCGVYVSRFLPGTTDLIFDGDPGGCIDDAAALQAALVAAGRTVTVVDNGFTFIDDYDCIDSADNVWVTMGTFPDSFALTLGEGIALADGVILDEFNLYVAGGDIWGFDLATALFGVDGVLGLELDGNLAADGDDSFIVMDGINGTLVDTSPFIGSSYSQDSNNPSIFAANDFTDQLGVDTGADSPAGSISEAIWLNADVGNPYVTGIAKSGPDDSTGRVISKSWEFGGFGGSQNTLMNTYLAFFGGGGGGENCTNGSDDDGDSLVDCADPDCVGTPPCPSFKRGDCNSDGLFNIADPIFVLSVLFPGGGTPPAIQCQDSCDSNDDGSLNIADPIASLGVQFPTTSPPPVLPAPFPACGADPTADSFGCLNYLQCP